MSRIYFPLRTSVELFEDRTSPEAVTRAKEAAVLYDELLFETGLYDTSITPTGSTGWWMPPHQLTEERLQDTRRPVPLGAPMTLAIGAQPGPGEPAKEMHLVLDGEVSAQYIAEFHSGILTELEQFSPNWVNTAVIGGSDNPARSGEPIYEAIRRLDFADLGDKELMPETESFLKSFIYKSFNRDSVLAAAMEASFSVTPLFAPMVERRGITPDHAGSEALSILVPNLGALPWEGVVEYREHPGSAEARARLREFEQLAAKEEPQDAYDFPKGVSREVNRAYQAAIVDLAPKLPEDLAKEALRSAVERGNPLLGVEVHRAHRRHDSAQRAERAGSQLARGEADPDRRHARRRRRYFAGIRVSGPTRRRLPDVNPPCPALPDIARTARRGCG